MNVASTSRGNVDGLAAALDSSVWWEASPVVPLSTRTTSSNSAAFELPKGRPIFAGVFVLDVVSASGTLDAVLEESDDGGSTWSTTKAFSQVTTAGKSTVAVAAAGLDADTKVYRIAWTLGGGSPSFEFGVGSILITDRR